MQRNIHHGLGCRHNLNPGPPMPPKDGTLAGAAGFPDLRPTGAAAVLPVDCAPTNGDRGGCDGGHDRDHLCSVEAHVVGTRKPAPRQSMITTAIMPMITREAMISLRDMGLVGVLSSMSFTLA